MRIVIQCAATKTKAPLGSGVRTADGRPVHFVAHPRLAPTSDDVVYMHPDDLRQGGSSWRDHILSYNDIQPDNPSRLLPAYRLYVNPVYRHLVERFGIGNIFILSAGWGLVHADFLLPHYDVTFSNAKNVKPFARRRKTDDFADFRLIPDDGERMVFLGGRDYLPLFYELTKGLKSPKYFFSRSTPVAKFDGLDAIPFRTNRCTNWHYECAKMLISGDISPWP